MHKKTFVALAAMASIVVALTGCSGAASGAKSDDKKSSDPETPSSGATPAGLEYSVAKTVDKDAITLPGTKLTVGDTAVIPASGDLDGSDEPVYSRAYDITLTSVDKGDPADFTDYELTGASATQIPYYLRYTMKTNSGTEHTSLGTISFPDHWWTLEVTGGKNDPTGLSLMGSDTFAPCPEMESATLEDLDAGTEYTGCSIVMIDPESKVKDAVYIGSGISDPYSDDPVVFGLK